MMMMKLADIAEEIKYSIFAFSRHCGFNPTSQQADILKAIEDVTLAQEWAIQNNKNTIPMPNRVAAKSGQGTGKSAAMAIAAYWRGLRAPKSKIIVTAPSIRQCKEVHLSELRRLQANPGMHPAIRKTLRVEKSKAYFNKDPDWVISPIPAARTEQSQGAHEKNMTVIMEEASGIPAQVFEQFEGTCSQFGNLLLAVGNPNTRRCSFFGCFHRFRHLWKTFTLNAEKSPLVSKANLQYLAEKYGKTSDVYRVRVLGEFPNVDPNAIFDAQTLDAASSLEIPPPNHSPHPEKQIGIDLARFGSDESVVMFREGYNIVHWQFFVKTEPFDVIDYAFKIQHDLGWDNSECLYVYDATGMGNPLAPKFSKANKRFVQFQNHKKPAKKDYADLITEAHFLFAKVLPRCQIPADTQLHQQLSLRLYEIREKDGKIMVESKSKFTKREEDIGSPDRAEALLMAFYPFPGYFAPQKPIDYTKSPKSNPFSLSPL